MKKALIILTFLVSVAAIPQQTKALSNGDLIAGTALAALGIGAGSVFIASAAFASLVEIGYAKEKSQGAGGSVNWGRQAAGIIGLFCAGTALATAPIAGLSIYKASDFLQIPKGHAFLAAGAASLATLGLICGGYKLATKIEAGNPKHQ